MYSNKRILYLSQRCVKSRVLCPKFGHHFQSSDIYLPIYTGKIILQKLWMDSVEDVLAFEWWFLFFLSISTPAAHYVLSAKCQTCSCFIKKERDAVLLWHNSFFTFPVFEFPLYMTFFLVIFSNFLLMSFSVSEFAGFKT